MLLKHSWFFARVHSLFQSLNFRFFLKFSPHSLDKETDQIEKKNLDILQRKNVTVSINANRMTFESHVDLNSRFKFRISQLSSTTKNIQTSKSSALHCYTEKLEI